MNNRELKAMRYKITLCVLYGVLELCYARKVEIGALIEFDKNVMNQLQEYMNTKDILSAKKPSHQPTEPNNKENESFDSRRTVKDYLKGAVSVMKSYDEKELCSMFNVAMGKIRKLTVNDDDTDKAILRNVKALEEIPCSDIGGLLNETMLALNGKKYTGAMSWLHLIDTLNTTNVLDSLKIIAFTPTETPRKRNFDPDEVIRKTIRNILKVINKIYVYMEEQNRKTKHLLRQQLPKSKPNKLLGEIKKPSMIDKIRPIIEETRKPENEDRHRILLLEHNFPSGGHNPSEQNNNPSGDHHDPSVENHKLLRGHKKVLREKHKLSVEYQNRPPRDQTKDTYILNLEKRRITRLPKKIVFETGHDLTSTTTFIPSPRKIKKVKKKNNTRGKEPKIEKQHFVDMIKPIVSMLLHGVDINLASGEHSSSTKDPVLDILYGRSQRNSKSREYPTTPAEALIDKPLVLKFI